MSAFNYDNTIELCRAILRQAGAAERANPLAGFHAVSIQSKTTLECLLHLRPEVDLFVQNGDRLVHATLENIKANLDSTLHNLMKFFCTHTRTSTVSSHAAGFAMQQRLLLMRDELSMNIHHLLSYHNRLRERMTQKDRVPLGPTQRHNVPPVKRETRAPQRTQNPYTAPAHHVPLRSSRSNRENCKEPSACRGRVPNSQEIPLRRKSSSHGQLHPRRRPPHPEETKHREGSSNRRDLPRPKSVQSLHRANPSSQPGQDKHSHCNQDPPPRSNSTQPQRLERLHGNEHSRRREVPSKSVDRAPVGSSAPRPHKISGPVSMLFADSFNGTRSILAQCCAEIFRLWTLNNGASSPFSAIDSAGTRLSSAFLNDGTIQDWTFYDPNGARPNHAALRALFAHADTAEESDIGARLSKHQPRGLSTSDFEDFDFILTLDQTNFSRLCYLRTLLPTCRARIFLLEQVHAPTSPPLGGGPPERASVQGESESSHAINYEPLITTLKAALRTFLAAHTTWEPPTHPPFSCRYTPFRSRQFVAPVGIREPTARRLEELRRRTGCEIAVDRVVWGREEARTVAVVSVRGREEVLRDEFEIVMSELGGWI